jgi:hypothetical protein
LGLLWCSNRRENRWAESGNPATAVQLPNEAPWAKAGTTCCPGVAAQMKRHGARRRNSEPVPDDTRYQQGLSRLPTDPADHAWARPSAHQRFFPGPGADGGHRDPRASGSVNRSSSPESVRHMSVTTAMQGLTAAHHDTRRDKSKTARAPGYAQATGRFRWWWQVLGSNQRRLSRRFYRPLPLATRATCLAPPASTAQ